MAWYTRRRGIYARSARIGNTDTHGLITFSDMFASITMIKIRTTLSCGRCFLSGLRAVLVADGDDLIADPGRKRLVSEHSLLEFFHLPRKVHHPSVSRKHYKEAIF